MSTYQVSVERTPERELQWISNLFCTCVLLTSTYKPLSLTCISQQVIDPSTHKRYERARECFFLSFFSSLSFSPSPSHPVPATNLGGSLPLAWVAGTRRGGGEEGGGGEKWERGRVWAFLSTLILLFPFLSLPSSPYHKSGWSFTISVGEWHKKGRREEGGKVWEGKGTFLLLPRPPL